MERRREIYEERLERQSFKRKEGRLERERGFKVLGGFEGFFFWEGDIKFREREFRFWVIKGIQLRQSWMDQCVVSFSDIIQFWEVLDCWYGCYCFFLGYSEGFCEVFFQSGRGGFQVLGSRGSNRRVYRGGKDIERYGDKKGEQFVIVILIFKKGIGYCVVVS